VFEGAPVTAHYDGAYPRLILVADIEYGAALQLQPAARRASEGLIISLDVSESSGSATDVIHVESLAEVITHSVHARLDVSLLPAVGALTSEGVPGATEYRSRESEIGSSPASTRAIRS
jgi:hypothetical protein